jgi:hypothetical protein
MLKIQSELKKLGYESEIIRSSVLVHKVGRGVKLPDYGGKVAYMPYFGEALITPPKDK